MSPSLLSTAACLSRLPAADRASEASLGDYLAFKLGAEEYGIDIDRVQAIRSYEEPARLRNAPAFIKGAINLGGVIVPVLDMRLRLNLAPVPYDHSTVVIVLDTGRCAVGLVVDSVSDVTALTAAPLRPVPEGRMAVAGDRTLTLLDIDELLSEADLGRVVPTLQ